uniref:Uncharacterized protein n=1 Tax=Octactis speculum TaxID=3111310 RepID=A0A7S2G097_9STRA|mmetsp:Transcript_35818/g.48387  ORF Transcript_35818/g.48387 Transcript_35818/m.48387 type:complete len:107 (+) Transcript_35818:44-364(+)|eukprot:CAMPEP_0185766356 /NCGR_PEP_ID=MMETSP1174-20130828/36327_1 /TAXON_ID=35687 /ORGANISM="Dictyocha speculum, Strain CCMP1381" /LENGTH=106 /DNA_ID=CAMNT_0028449981 /DNA_START=43 /DNA_END=363 /DNA_ORIENTATION=+
MSLLNRGARVMIPKVLQRSSTRAMSGGHCPVQAEADMNNWIKISVVAIGGVSVAGVVIGYLESQHHHHEAPPRSFKKIRAKPYPWECSDCTLFDLECWKECRANKE